MIVFERKIIIRVLIDIAVVSLAWVTAVSILNTLYVEMGFFNKELLSPTYNTLIVGTSELYVLISYLCYVLLKNKINFAFVNIIKVIVYVFTVYVGFYLISLHSTRAWHLLSYFLVSTAVIALLSEIAIFIISFVYKKNKDLFHKLLPVVIYKKMFLSDTKRNDEEVNICFKLFQVLLFVTPVLLFSGLKTVSEITASLCFIFLVIGFSFKIFGRKKNENKIK